MPKFRFIGDPNDNLSGPDVLEMFGMKFPRDRWVHVPEGRECEKLSGNAHFDADYGDEIATDGSLIEPGPKRKVVATDAKMDALLAEADAVGLKVDGRWSKARLEGEISAAKIAKAG